MHPLTMPADVNGHAAPITGVAFNCTGDKLATSSYDGVVGIWDVESPESPAKILDFFHRRLVNNICWSPTDPFLLASASADKTAAIWETGPSDSGLRLVLSRHTDDVNSVAWSPDSKVLYCVSEDGRATRWDALNGRYLGEIAAHASHCMMVAVSGTGIIATVGEDGLVAISSRNGLSLAKKQYPDSIEGCAWSNDSKCLAIARDSGYIDILSSDLKVNMSTRVADVAARSVSWSKDNENLIVGAYDGSVHIVDSSGRVKKSRFHEQFWPRSLAVTSKMIAVGSFAAAPHLLNYLTLEPIFDPPTATHGVNAIVLDNQCLNVGTDAGEIVSSPINIKDLSVQETIPTLTKSPVLSLIESQGIIFAGRYSGHITKSDLVQAEHLMKSENFGAPIPSMLGLEKTLMAGTYNGDLIELSMTSLREIRRYSPHSGSIKSLALVADSDVFISGATDRQVQIGTFADRRVLWEHGNLVNAVATGPDGLIASASRDHTVKLAQITSDYKLSRRPITLLAGSESMKTVAILGSAQQPIVIAGSYDFGLYVWHVDWNSIGSTLRIGKLHHIFGQAVSTVMAIDESSAVAVSWDGTILRLTIGFDGQLETLSAEKCPKQPNVFI
jgi:toxoflavin biosynthesis protein ToxC